MKKNKDKNEEIQNRRSFFKKMAKAALPALAVIGLSSLGGFGKILANETTKSDCQYGCMGSCEGTCAYSCQGNCQHYCEGTCKDSCEITCRNGCEKSCKHSCEGSCDKHCTGKCYLPYPKC